jgi:hypothetical protein
MRKILAALIAVLGLISIASPASAQRSANSAPYHFCGPQNPLSSHIDCGPLAGQPFGAPHRVNPGPHYVVNPYHSNNPCGIPNNIRAFGFNPHVYYRNCGGNGSGGGMAAGGSYGGMHGGSMTQGHPVQTGWQRHLVGYQRVATGHHMEITGYHAVCHDHFRIDGVIVTKDRPC